MAREWAGASMPREGMMSGKEVSMTMCTRRIASAVLLGALVIAPVSACSSGNQNQQNQNQNQN